MLYLNRELDVICMVKKITTGFVSFVLLNLLILLAFNMNIKNIINDIIDNSGVNNKINDVISIYFNKNDMDIINNDEVEEIIDDIVTAIIENNEEEMSNLIVDIINKKRDKLKSYGINDVQIDNVIYEIEANITSSNDNNIELSNEQKLGLLVYKYASSNSLKTWIIIGIIISSSLLLIINKLQALKDIGIGLFGAGILIKVMCVFIDSIVNSGNIKDIIGDIKINLTCFDKFILIYIIMGLILILVYVIYKIFYKDKKALS